MISPGPVTPAKGKTRKLTVKASDPFSDAAVKGSPPDTPDSMGTTLVLSPYPKKAVKSNLTAASIEPPEPNVNPKSQDQDSQEDKESICYESDTQTELTEGTLVEVASTDSDEYLSEKDRLKSRKAALYVEWRDYYNHQKSFGEDVHAETLQEFTTSGLLAAGWQQNPGNFHWHKPGASKAASVARAGSRTPKSNFVWMKKSKASTPQKKPATNAKAKAMKVAITSKKKKTMHNKSINKGKKTMHKKSIPKVKKTIEKNKGKHGGAFVSQPKVQVKISGKRIGKPVKAFNSKTALAVSNWEGGLTTCGLWLFTDSSSGVQLWVGVGKVSLAGYYR